MYCWETLGAAFKCTTHLHKITAHRGGDNPQTCTVGARFTPGICRESDGQLVATLRPPLLSSVLRGFTGVAVLHYRALSSWGALLLHMDRTCVIQASICWSSNHWKIHFWVTTSMILSFPHLVALLIFRNFPFAQFADFWTLEIKHICHNLPSHSSCTLTQKHGLVLIMVSVSAGGPGGRAAAACRT